MADPTERFRAKYSVDSQTGCWIWHGALSAEGYGRFTARSYRTIAAHRFAWESVHGILPTDAVLDHLCRNRACVNPDHLEAVTNRTNILRGVGAPATNARKTHCPRGHEFTEATTYRYPDGRRECRTCRREYHREYMRARRAAQWS